MKTTVILYIDPGTGSMLFSLAIAIATALVFAVKALINKMKFILSAGKVDGVSTNKIPYVIYCDDKRYYNIFKPICDEFEKREVELVYYTQSHDDPIFEKEYMFVKPEFIGEGNKGIARMNFLKAKNVLSTTPGLDVLQWKRSREVERYIHIPHAVGGLGGYRTFGIDHYDSILTCSERQNEEAKELERVRNIQKKELVIVGCPYMDEADRIISEKYQSRVVDINNITVILAPSWGPSSLLSKYGDELVSKLVETGFHIIIRPHPDSYKSEKEIIAVLKEKYAEYENVEWNSDNNNVDVLSRADIMVSDFSGVVYDFALLFERPVIMAYEQFDTIIYDYDWMDYNVWHYKELDDFGAWLTSENISDIKNIIVDLLTNDEKKEARIAAKKVLWRNQGKGAEKVVDYMMGESNNELKN